MRMDNPSSGRRRGRVTIKQVAEHAGVDPSVVSRVINHDPRLSVRPETRERVVAAIKELGYRPNAVGRSLRTARAGMLGLFIPDFANPVYAEIIKGAEAAAAQLGYLLVTGSASGSKPGTGHYVDLLGQGRVDGLLLAGTDASSALIDRLNDALLPWILVNQRVSWARRYVILDDERAGDLAVEHLVDLGHRRIAHLAGPPTSDTARRRRAGYLAAMERVGLAHDERLIVDADYTPAGGAAAIADLLALDEPPTAVFVANVASAIGALHAAQAAGVEVPRDLSLVAVHDLPLAGYLTPPLTTVRMPLEDLGRRGVELLTGSDPDAPIEETVDNSVELIVRDSTTRPPRRRRKTLGAADHG
ncbi:LacI family DNA-binding transcriptional regulator [Streptomyces sp. MMS24-I31]|uniref:LacI family DNA-binding transcriptional regulator n=1 Tax=Streptomyces sp. MMS24-I31 TaxID=3351563 RepID=UPI003896E9ED